MQQLPLQIFVLDLVSMLMIILIGVQFFYIFKLHKRLHEQNKALEQLKEVVYAIYKSAKGDKSVELDFFKTS